MRTQVGIVGAGPAGLTLGRLLEHAGIESVVLESRSREYVEHRIRAGVLEQGRSTCSATRASESGCGARGIVHHGIELQFDGERHRIPLSELTGGRSIVIYGQTEVVKDLIAARLEAGAPLLFEVDDVSVHDIESERPHIRFTHEGARRELDCDVIAGCDGFHGVCRPAIPTGVLRTFEREYPFGWLGILAAVAPSNDELIYSHHERGFALLSLRSPSSQPPLHPVPARRGHRRVARRPDLGGAADPARARRLDAGRGAGAREGRDRDAQLRRRADAARPALPRRGRRAHRAARPAQRGSTWRSRDVALLADGARGLVRRAATGAGSTATPRLPAPRLACGALLVVDDLDAPPPRRGRRLRAAAPALPAPLRDDVAGRRHDRWPRTTSGSRPPESRRTIPPMRALALTVILAAILVAPAARAGGSFERIVAVGAGGGSSTIELAASGPRSESALSGTPVNAPAGGYIPSLQLCREPSSGARAVLSGVACDLHDLEDRPSRLRSPRRSRPAAARTGGAASAPARPVDRSGRRQLRRTRAAVRERQHLRGLRARFRTSLDGSRNDARCVAADRPLAWPGREGSAERGAPDAVRHRCEREDDAARPRDLVLSGPRHPARSNPSHSTPRSRANAADGGLLGQRVML